LLIEENRQVSNAKAAFPAATLLLAMLVALLFLATRDDDASLLPLLYSRAALADGEFWRLLSGHLTHFSWTHLAADLGGFVLLGMLIESEQGKSLFGGLLLYLALGTSSALWLFVPELWFYGGISALNYGLLTWLCVTQRTLLQKNWQWAASVLPLLILTHIGWQYTTERSLLDAGLPRYVRVAWQAHLAAVLLAFAFAAARTAVRTPLSARSSTPST
jgi:rhomboid family GlyGly-CTERM serine protease